MLLATSTKFQAQLTIFMNVLMGLPTSQCFLLVTGATHVHTNSLDLIGWNMTIPGLLLIRLTLATRTLRPLIKPLLPILEGELDSETN